LNNTLVLYTVCFPSDQNLCWFVKLINTNIMEISKFKKLIMFISMMSVLFMTRSLFPHMETCHQELKLQAEKTASRH